MGAGKTTVVSPLLSMPLGMQYPKPHNTISPILMRVKRIIFRNIP